MIGKLSLCDAKKVKGQAERTHDIFLALASQANSMIFLSETTTTTATAAPTTAATTAATSTATLAAKTATTENLKASVAPQGANSLFSSPSNWIYAFLHFETPLFLYEIHLLR